MDIFLPLTSLILLIICEISCENCQVPGPPWESPYLSEDAKVGNIYLNTIEDISNITSKYYIVHTYFIYLFKVNNFG